MVRKKDDIFLSYILKSKTLYVDFNSSKCKKSNLIEKKFFFQHLNNCLTSMKNDKDILKTPLSMSFAIDSQQWPWKFFFTPLSKWNVILFDVLQSRKKNKKHFQNSHGDKNWKIFAFFDFPIETCVTILNKVLIMILFRLDLSAIIIGKKSLLTSFNVENNWI